MAVVAPQPFALSKVEVQPQRMSFDCAQDERMGVLGLGTKRIGDRT